MTSRFMDNKCLMMVLTFLLNHLCLNFEICTSKQHGINIGNWLGRIDTSFITTMPAFKPSICRQPPLLVKCFKNSACTCYNSKLTANWWLVSRDRTVLYHSWTLEWWILPKPSLSEVFRYHFLGLDYDYFVLLTVEIDFGCSNPRKLIPAVKKTNLISCTHHGFHNRNHARELHVSCHRRLQSQKAQIQFQYPPSPPLDTSRLLDKPKNLT